MQKRKFTGYPGILLLRKYVENHGDSAVYEFLTERKIWCANEEERNRAASILLAAEAKRD